MRVFVAGATGVLGRRLLPLLLQEGHSVVAMTRSPDRTQILEKQGVEAVICDAFDEERLRFVVAEARPKVVINQLTSIPARLEPRKIKVQMVGTNRLRMVGSRLLADAARQGGAERLISQSISFAYRPEGYGPAVEDEPLYTDAPEAFRELICAVEKAEEATLDSPLKGVVLRYGFFTGPGTIYAPGGSFFADVKRRRLPILGDGGGRFSFVHVDDAAAATVAALAAPPGVYNIVDHEPAAVRDWLPWYAHRLGAKAPFRVPSVLGRLGAGPYGHYMMLQQRGALNNKALEALDWQPRFPSWRESLGAELWGVRNAPVEKSTTEKS